MSDIKNVFYKLARNKAVKMLGKKSRLLVLLAQLGNKLRHVDFKAMAGPSGKEKLFILGRLAKAYALGQYKVIPWKSMVSILAAIIYFVSPIDLIPDFIPVIGLSDDLAVLVWVYKSATQDIKNFIAWEKLNALNQVA